ncbi:hypothetical protein DO97_04450 [Neosynechococcus sphagnicola sy1]|uniref:Uncharacterized protein n=1 Tax=Neosynechococcus sphagnicola sy1 TaxID=1497020 RepID=A0A098TM51_9CYAN|nr:hypothetical protein [Neosynechococcus sphagnicola]KGF72942.1 hypothetical protein DO97_04450 [Neosynechococcus sphagnicola sy1]
MAAGSNTANTTSTVGTLAVTSKAFKTEGVCFRVNASGQMRFDNGTDTTTYNIAVETATETKALDGSNLGTPVRVVLLDELTHRPIPVPGIESFNVGSSTRRGSQLINSTGTRVNAIVISGLIPPRPNASNGGLHNFPRFLENWSGVDLFISGALIQLNYSSSANGPFDQDAWEPPTAASTGLCSGGICFGYYSPPNRRWGYDVGLQYSAASPVTKRMAELTKSRDEFYRELDATDPYICKLRAVTTKPC